MLQPTTDAAGAASCRTSSLTSGLVTVRTSTQRFQAATRKIINVQRTMSYTKGWSTAGREPGIDPARVDLPDLHNKCVVQVADICREVSFMNILEVVTDGCCLTGCALHSP